MGRIVYTFSVAEHSVADSKLKQWREEEVNISAMICMLIEDESTLVDHNNSLKKKILRLKDLTNHRRMTEDEWQQEFMMW